MVGVLLKYFVKKVVHFNHSDFMKALKQDLQPLLGEVGLWALNNYCTRQLEKGKVDKRKKGLLCIDIVKSYLEVGLDYLSQEKKYYFMNKFSPKKLPDQGVKREAIESIYSWLHYAPQGWYEHLKKTEE